LSSNALPHAETPSPIIRSNGRTICPRQVSLQETAIRDMNVIELGDSSSCQLLIFTYIADELFTPWVF